LEGEEERGGGGVDGGGGGRREGRMRMSRKGRRSGVLSCKTQFGRPPAFTW
jgi:hypothetical protein